MAQRKKDPHDPARGERRKTRRTARAAPGGAGLDDLYRTILRLESVDECRRFFADLCTPAELEALRGRWRAARLIDRGQSYRTIHDSAGVSTTTVTRVARALSYGSGGYRLMLDRERAEAERRGTVEPAPKPPAEPRGKARRRSTRKSAGRTDR